MATSKHSARTLGGLLALSFVAALPAHAQDTCAQVIVCGMKGNAVKEYPTPCAAAADGATHIAPKTAGSCSVTENFVDPKDVGNAIKAIKDNKNDNHPATKIDTDPGVVKGTSDVDSTDKTKAKSSDPSPADSTDKTKAKSSDPSPADSTDKTKAKSSDPSPADSTDKTKGGAGKK